MHNKLFDLSGRTALVTGGSKGLGAAMARAFAEAGADVAICSRHEDELKAAAASIAAGLNVRVEWIATDMADRNQVDALAEAVLSRMGRVDILVNNAGSNTPQSIEGISDDTLGSHYRAESFELHAPDACPGSSNEGAPLGKESFTSPRCWGWAAKRAGAPTAQPSRRYWAWLAPAPWILDLSTLR